MSYDLKPNFEGPQERRFDALEREGFQAARLAEKTKIAPECPYEPGSVEELYWVAGKVSFERQFNP